MRTLQVITAVLVAGFGIFLCSPIAVLGWQAAKLSRKGAAHFTVMFGGLSLTGAELWLALGGLALMGVLSMTAAIWLLTSRGESREKKVSH